MKVISSQHYIDWTIVEQKMDEIAGNEFVEIPCYEIGKVDGEEFAIQADRHHTMPPPVSSELKFAMSFSLSPRDFLENLRWNLTGMMEIGMMWKQAILQTTSLI